MKINPMHLCDFYKTGHIAQYPDGTEMIYSNFTPRMSRIKGVDEVVVFGVQFFVQEYLINLWNKNFFELPKDEVIASYKRRMDTSLGVDAISVDHVAELHDLGYLPLKVKALEEGSLCPISVPMLTIKNTKPEFFWLTNYLESLMSTILWKPMTSATTAYQYWKEFKRHADKTGSPEDFIQWQGHDFSFRGMSGITDAVMSGAGHLLSFTGTDTVHAIDFMEEFYNADATQELIGGSVPATEHSVMCAGGLDDEFGTFKRLITETYPNGLVSIVSDTWDFWKVMTEFLPALKDDIIARDGRVVIRPDSGEPVDIICGTNNVVDLSNEKYCTDLDKCGIWMADGIIDAIAEDTPHGECGVDEDYELFKYNDKYYKCTINPFWNRHDKQYYYIDGWDTEIIEHTPKAEEIGAYELLWDTFGGTVNEQGYKVLNPKIGLIYGDSITMDRQKEILKRLEDKGFTASNLVLGIGSFTYEYVTRDTFGFAMKATACTINGEYKAIFKDPKTDSGFKKSAKGFLAVHEDSNGKLKLTDNLSEEPAWGCMLRTVFLDGKSMGETSLSQIRNKLKSYGI
jgi:nicotinamide phosphoribosyltransferase